MLINNRGDAKGNTEADGLRGIDYLSCEKPFAGTNVIQINLPFEVYLVFSVLKLELMVFILLTICFIEISNC